MSAPRSPQHVSHWQALHLDGYLGGPFEDRSGGLITFETEDEEYAKQRGQLGPLRPGRLSSGAFSWLDAGSPNDE